FDRGQDVRIPISRVSDGKMHRFAYRADGKLVRFILVKTDSDKIGVAFDACAICGDKGYYQQGQDVICKNCTAPINPASIGQSGGCNPIELKHRIEEAEIIIPATELDAGAGYFTATPSGEGWGRQTLVPLSSSLENVCADSSKIIHS